MTAPASDLALPRLPERAPPTRVTALLFEAKVFVFRLIRAATESRPRLLARGVAQEFPALVAESNTPLWSDPRPGEQPSQLGKIHNLRLAARAFDGLLLAPGDMFSFWRQLGRTSRARGFVRGRMLKEGCMVSSVGGGLCQLSNALYAVALDAGCEIVERHGHSRIVPNSAAAIGRDATIAWNYVDLRFRSATRLMLRVRLTRDRLVVQLLAPESKRAPAFAPDVGEARDARTCGTCNQTDCFRHEHGQVKRRTAFLVDENWPEFQRYVASARNADDTLALPLDGARWRMGRYAWDRAGFERVASAPLATLRRAIAQRRAKTAPARRAAELQGAERIARALANQLSPDVTDVTVAQSLLPTLWCDGHLGGRRFSVLMTRMPMTEIQARLDAAARAHPERKTLSDFRADPSLVTAETEALAVADRIITPHTEIARLFGERALLLDWQTPKPTTHSDAVVPKRIAFPGPTLARKGAYELREAARALDLEVVLVGGNHEGADFWNGVRTMRADSANWLDGVACVVQPAILEDAPRRLLIALSHGIPVIATRACGLREQNDLTLVPEGDTTALTKALSAKL